MADPLYRIMAGVRRAVAARELGLPTVRAMITAGPDNGKEFDVLLTALYSPKDRLSRSAQGGRYDDVERAMADPAIRPRIPAIEIVPLRSDRARYFTPLAAVILEP